MVRSGSIYNGQLASSWMVGKGGVKKGVQEFIGRQGRDMSRTGMVALNDAAYCSAQALVYTLHT